jgi:hypothetical protein
MRQPEMRLYRRDLAETLEEWNKKGCAPGHICGLIEGSHVGHGLKEKSKVRRVKGGMGRHGSQKY